MRRKRRRSARSSSPLTDEHSASVQTSPPPKPGSSDQDSRERPGSLSATWRSACPRFLVPPRTMCKVLARRPREESGVIRVTLAPNGAPYWRIDMTKRASACRRSIKPSNRSAGILGTSRALVSSNRRNTNILPAPAEVERPELFTWRARAAGRESRRPVASRSGRRLRAAAPGSAESGRGRRRGGGRRAGAPKAP